MSENEERLASIIRRLRDRIFLHERYAPSPERQWESEEEELLRQERNRVNRQKWDEETEALIRVTKT